MGQVRDGGEASGDQAGHELHDRRARRTLGGLCAPYEPLRLVLLVVLLVVLLLPLRLRLLLLLVLRLHLLVFLLLLLLLQAAAENILCRL